MSRNDPFFDDDATTGLEAFEAEMKARKTLKESISVADLDDAITVTIDTLRTGWSTSGGRRLQQFVWSLWNDSHLINLYDLPYGLDGKLTVAVNLLFQAAMVDVLTEDQKRNILTESGEFARWEECRRNTPKDEEVHYPLPPLSADDLMSLAISAKRSEKRVEDQRKHRFSNCES
jgi:hypothetical protein